jgi:hypothetical protein
MPMWCQGLARSMKIFVQLLLACTASAACSSDPDEPTGITSAEYCRRVAESVCADLAGCCRVTVEACVDAHRSNCEAGADNATTRGLAFNAEAAQRCADASVGAYTGCVVPSFESEDAAICAAVFSATLAPGASCTFDAACRGADGLVGVCSSGACAQVSILAEGDPCEGAEGRCAGGTYCSGTCQPLKTTGQSCETALECSSGWCENQSCGARPLSTLCSSLTESK